MKISTSVVVVGLCLGELACSSDSPKGERNKPDATNGSGGAPSSGGSHAHSDAGPDAGSGGTSTTATPDTGAPHAEASTDSIPACPKGFECVSTTGIYVCENPGPEIVPCETKDGCPFGACYAVSGQGVCLALCQPPEGLPSATSIGGVVTEFTAGAGFAGTTEAAKETPLAGVEVCLREPKLNVACVKTDASGKFTLTGIPPNRNLAVPVTAFVSFVKAGYLSMLRATALGNGNQTFSPQTRLYTTADAQAVATALGVGLPDSKTGWLGLGAFALNPDDTKRLSAFSEGTTKQITVEGATFSMDPARGSGPYYADASEQFSSPDASSGSTSIAGFGYFFDVPAGKYDVAVSHPKLECGGAINLEVVPGFVFSYVDALCGKGVK
jgi:hypothetical protein